MGRKIKDYTENYTELDVSKGIDNLPKELKKDSFGKIRFTEEEWAELNNGSKGTSTSQTAVEFLISKLGISKITHNKLFEEALQMEYKQTMDAMQRGMELQEKENNRIGFRERNGLLPQQEISDEEIEKFADEEPGTIRTDFDFGVIQGMKWYREQLKSRQ